MRQRSDLARVVAVTLLGAVVSCAPGTRPESSPAPPDDGSAVLTPPPSGADAAATTPGADAGVSNDAPGPISVNVDDGLSDAERQVIVDSVVPGGTYVPGPQNCTGTGTVKDARGKLVTTDFSGVGAPVPGCLIGAAVRGTFPLSLSWTVVKSKHDGDGIKWGRDKPGLVEIHGSYVDNIEDALGPPKSPETFRDCTWAIHNVYTRYTRDDFIENDACLDGKIHDCLVDGSYNFISARPGKSNLSKMAKYSATHDVSNVLVHLACAPDSRGDGGKDYCPKDESVGRLFKWSSCGGVVNMRDSILRVDAICGTGTKPMAFPPGKYENVWLIWTGSGSYPAAVPASGVTQVNDTKLWDMARAKWMSRHGCDPKGDHCTMTD
jgi:hypothetical protein